MKISQIITMFILRLKIKIRVIQYKNAVKYQKILTVKTN